MPASYSAKLFSSFARYARLRSSFDVMAEHIQGGIAASEVVHFDDEASGSQLIHRSDDLLGIFGISALGDLQMEELWVDAVFLGQIQEEIRKVGLVHIRPGDVDGNRKGRIALVLPLPKQLAGPLPHELVQLGDKAVFLKQGNKLAGGHEAPLRVNPPHQRLRAAQPAVAGPILGLKIDGKLIACQSGLHGGGDALLPQQLPAQNVVIDGDGLVVLPQICPTQPATVTE